MVKEGGSLYPYRCPSLMRWPGRRGHGKTELLSPTRASRAESAGDDIGEVA
jgi:hypothetical protein